MNIPSNNSVSIFKLVKLSSELRNDYLKNGKELFILFEEYYSLRSKNENKIISALLFHEHNYSLDQFRKKVEKKIQKKLLDLFKIFEDFYSNYSIYKLSLEDEKYLINKITIKKRLGVIEREFNNVLENLIIIFKFDYNEYRLRFSFISYSLNQIISNLEIIENLHNQNTLEVPKINYSKLKKLNIKDIKIGDIILVEKESRSLTLYRKLLGKMLNSNIIHSAIVYDIIGEDIFLFEANAYNSKEVSIDKLEFKKNYKYIIMRPSYNLNKLTKKKVQNLCDSYLGEKFSNLKLVVGSLERLREYILKYLPLLRKSNPSKSLNGTFCSEIVVRVYSKLGFNLGINEDSSIASPVDIFKSKSLNLIGYFK